MPRSTAALFALATSALAACGASPRGHTERVEREPIAGAQQSQHQKLVEEGDALWGQRADKAKLEEALARWEAAVELKDDDWETYAKLARGYYFLADGHLAFEATGGAYPYAADKVTDEAAREAYLNAHLRGSEFAERGMAAVSEDYEKATLRGAKAEDAVTAIGRRGVPLVYWYASNLGKWAKAKGFTTVLKHKDRIFKMVSHVYEIGQDYFYAAADRYFGAFYAVAPSFAGGDLQKSQEHFNASIKAAPDYLGTYVLAAELYAPKIQDPAIFEQYLQTVIDAPDDILPDLAPEIAVEKRKAEELLKVKNELF